MCADKHECGTITLMVFIGLGFGCLFVVTRNVMGIEAY